MNPSQLIKQLPKLLGDALVSSSLQLDEVTCEISAERITEVCLLLRDDPTTQFELLIDLCAIDYSSWGNAEEIGEEFGGKSAPAPNSNPAGSRFAVVYHLLSLQNNLRLRLRVALDDAAPSVDSVVEIWASANWYEREAFDLFGIMFRGHPDLRRLLTDYGFIGHPFRKDFPLSGEVEMKYDEEHGRVIYQPVTIEPRILVPRTIDETKPTGE